MKRDRRGCYEAAVCLTVGIGLSMSGATGAMGQVSSAPVMNHAPVWSRTRNLIAFDSDRTGVAAIYLIDPDVGTLRQISDGRAPACCVRWNRDGDVVVFEVGRNGQREVTQFSVRLGALDVVTDSQEPPESEAPDGATLFVKEQDGHSVVTIVNGDGSGDQLTRGTWASQPSFSPDGQLIVYEDRAGDDIAASRIVLMRRDGSRSRTLALGTDPSWAPDGSRILFKTPSDEVGGFGWEVAVVSVDGSSLTRLVPGVHPTWSPDGSRIAFMAEASRERTDIWIMNSDGGGRRCLTCM